LKSIILFRKSAMALGRCESDVPAIQERIRTIRHSILVARQTA